MKILIISGIVIVLAVIGIGYRLAGGTQPSVPTDKQECVQMYPYSQAEVLGRPVTDPKLLLTCVEPVK